MSRPRRLIAGAAAIMFGVLTAAAGGATPAAAAVEVNRNPEYLVVYDNNVENFLGEAGHGGSACSTNRFDNLVTYMANQRYSPDIFTVQQVAGWSDLQDLKNRLNARLPGTYDVVIADADPTAITTGDYAKPSQCEWYKRKQTNAIVYRSDRLTLDQSSVKRFYSYAVKNPSTTCVEARPENKIYGQARTYNVGARFLDTKAMPNKHVSVVSFHWPTYHDPKKEPGATNGRPCVAKNAAVAEDKLESLGGSSMYLMAGDSNAPASSGSWWNTLTSASHNYHDPMAEKCGDRDCLGGYATFTDKHRYDYLFARRTSDNTSDQFSMVNTISYTETGAPNNHYSDHRALVAYVKYPS